MGDFTWFSTVEERVIVQAVGYASDIRQVSLDSLRGELCYDKRIRQLTSTTASALEPGCFSAMDLSERNSCVRATVASASVVVYELVGSINRVAKLSWVVVGNGKRIGGMMWVSDGMDATSAPRGAWSTSTG